MVVFLSLLFTFSIASCQENKTLLFSNEFDESEINEKVWNFELGDGCPDLCGWGNNERQVYTRENAIIRENNLVITAAHDSTGYFSSKLTTKNNFEFQYGTIEVRAKLATGHGVWPAIWMLGHDIDSVGWPLTGEIDIMEYVGRAPHEIHTTLHTQDSHGKSKNTAVTKLKDIEEDFHIYKCDWTKEYIKFYIDDELVYTFSPEERNEEIWPFDKPFYIILNLAIGGNFGGPEVDDTIFPQEFIIDYVRVYKN